MIECIGNKKHICAFTQSKYRGWPYFMITAEQNNMFEKVKVESDRITK